MFYRLGSILSLGVVGLGLGLAGAEAKLGFGHDGFVATADADHMALAKAAVTKVLQPGYDAFAKDAEDLSAKTAALCAEPSEAALKEARSAFAKAVKGWSAVEIFQFGPVNRDNRYERLFFWPDRKGRGTRQVQEALREEDESVTSAKSLAEKSVALQGLPALEYLLYAEGAGDLAQGGDGGTFRCGFAAAVAENVALTANELADAWGPDSPFTKSFLAPEADGALYRAPKDVTLELSKALSGGIERVGDQKLGRMLGKSAERARPRLAPFWRSDLTFMNMADNLMSVKAVFFDAGFADIVRGESAGVEASILFDLARGVEVLEAEKDPVAEVVTDPEQRDKLEAVRVGLKNANGTASELIAKGAGLSFGFNAGDGD